MAEVVRVLTAVPWILFQASLFASLDIVLDAVSKGVGRTSLPAFIDLLLFAAPTSRSGAVVGLALLVEAVFVREVRWSLRYAPFAVLATALVLTGSTWCDLNSLMMRPMEHPPSRMLADIIVGVIACTSVAYWIIASYRRRHLS